MNNIDYYIGPNGEFNCTSSIEKMIRKSLLKHHLDGMNRQDLQKELDDMVDTFYHELTLKHRIDQEERDRS